MINWQLKTPVVFIIFNRPETTKTVFEILHKNFSYFLMDFPIKEVGENFFLTMQMKSCPRCKTTQILQFERICKDCRKAFVNG